MFKRPETKWANLEQVEKVMLTYFEGLNSYLLKKIEMTCD
jgi:hypothetical protein